MPKRIMFDTNVHDLVASDPVVLNAVRQSIADGRLKLITTHIQRDELSRAPEPKRTALLNIFELAEVVATAGAVWDVSNWDDCTWGTDHINASITKLMGGNPRHAEDALISATASSDADALVTNETRLASKAERAGFSGDIWSWHQFVAWLSR